MLSTIKRVVFFGAHTDDEMICAGTLHRLARLGCETYLVTIAPAAVECDSLGGERSLLTVLPEWHRSAELLNVIPDRRACLCWTPSVDLYHRRQSICQVVFDFCEIKKPDLAIILSPYDENTAHALVGTECERVMRGRVSHVWRCIFPWNYHGERPNLYVSLSQEDLDVKRAVINAYQSQKFRYDYETMLMAQVVADGLSVKVSAAEKFEIVRSVL